MTDIYMGETILELRDGRRIRWRPRVGAPLRVVAVAPGGGAMELREEVRAPSGHRVGRFRAKGPVRVAHEQAFRPMMGTRIEPAAGGLAAKLYVGLNVGTEIVWTEQEVEEAVLAIRRAQGVDPGASILLQLGIYEQQGTVIEEPSVLIGILDFAGTDEDVWERQMFELGAALRERFNQESVLVEIQRDGRTIKLVSAKGPLGPILEET